MKLLTKKLENDLANAEQGSTKVLAKFFHPFSTWKWYATEYDPSTKEFFGLVHGDYTELGYFPLSDLESVNIYGLKIERDLYWDATTEISTLKENLIRTGAE